MFDTVVIGGGHAGIEAALAARRRGASVALVTFRSARVGEMSCNPAIGGVAKGVVVSEIDALGGAMAEAADAASVQFRMLNRRKGPAVWGPRVQCDAAIYASKMREAAGAAGIVIIEGEASSFRWHGDQVQSVVLSGGSEIRCRSAVLAPGTFLGGVLFRGREKWSGGRMGDPSSDMLAQHLVERGFHVERFKTGTPPRLLTRSLDYGKLEVQSEEGPDWRFSVRKIEEGLRTRVVCHTTKAGRRAIDAAKAGLSESPLHTGRISSKGPRYCPSFEDKAMRFPDREGHPVFLEPMGIGSRLTYVNGVSTSLSRKSQLEVIRSIPGCERAVVAVWGYAVEYGYLPGDQMDPGLRLEKSDNLFVAGQICGTSGYEEAGGLGLVAGANAAACSLACPRFIPDRKESYIGVMVSDVIAANLLEPYRLFSSRSENRMHLRPDNASRRLSRVAIRHQLSREGDEAAASEVESAAASILGILSSSSCGGRKLSDLCRQPDFDTQNMILIEPLLSRFDAGLVHSIALDERYGGYVEKAVRRSREIERLSGLSLAGIDDYGVVHEISWEARDALGRRRPASLREAASVPGVRPSDLDGLLIHILRRVPRGTPAG